ncbi:LexA-binding, inner membrane-associated putative hydrolase [Oceanospirillum multiglobuliferum]|uniref:Metal-dependent hydrolase n=1 Tax=Oceanospirillum multiglobuliferum TaxID=64969 RepID=A0A1T4SML7_9GAMM|nr:metal-dependent hydrolase [Oceanospirillum multiglobuliferum]OPX54171.1 hypothetical protein BTE48_15540 [Oceanospirillum multiglobuliferum]SKA29425.1 LexA-binding, inner membrane-associated putative hydrolase [Oceanospirillum multiglobuliferum]
MANYQTHIVGAALGGGLVVSGAVVINLVPLTEALVGWGLVMVGGILPDIDSKHSRSVRSIFSLLGALIAVVTVLALNRDLGISGAWLAAAASFFVVRFGAWYLLTRFTVHRGIFHSLLAGLFFALLTAVVAYQGLRQDEEVSWFMGLCLLIGFVIHLLLDECYSVDLSGARLKRSFGTAFKLFDYRNIKNTLLMGAIAAGLVMLSPPLEDLWFILADSRIHWSLGRNW